VNGRSNSTWRTLLPAAIILAAGLLVDFQFTGARAAQVTRLNAQREALRSQIAGQNSRDQRVLELSRHLGGADLRGAWAAQRAVDPVIFLGRALREAGLRSIELGTEPGMQTAQVQRARYYVEAQGDYKGLLRFIQRLESDPRVLTIDGFTADKIIGEAGLDIRVALSFYEPLGGR
jgi:hypothetical protein